MQCTMRSAPGRRGPTTCANVFFDALQAKIRDEGRVRNKAVYLTIGIHCSGNKEL